MAKVSRDQSMRSYIATENFVGDFFTYAVKKVEFNTVGTLSLVTVDSTKCPAGRVLRENGRKLAPGMNPGVATYMVGVYDNQTGLSGFIDPNSPVFAVYNNSRPNFLVDNVDPGDGASGGSSNLTDRSAPVLTNGLVSAATTVSAGLTVTAGTGVIATTGNITATAGKLVVPSYSTATVAATFNAGNATAGNIPLAGGVINNGYKRVVVNTTACSANSRIFLTYSGLVNPGFLSSEGIANGQFTITSSSATGDATYNTVTYTGDAGVVHFFIVN
jgi:hypothetical protein